MTAAAATLAGAPAVHAAKRLRWKLVTSWPPNFPILQTGTERFAKRVEEMSGGRLSIRVYAGGELVPPLEVFDAVSAGTVQMGNGASYYWAGKAPEAQFFTSVPFGFTAQQMNAWLYHGGGLELWNKVYERFNLAVVPLLNTGVQMGLWMKKEIRSIDDFKGMKIRVPGLGGKVMAKAGVNVVLMPAGELYTALERGVIDAVDWVGPYHDMTLGFQRAAKYYYHPGWREPGSVAELMINRRAWEGLPGGLRAIVRAAAAENNVSSLSEFMVRNGAALEELTGKYGVKVTEYPAGVIKKFHELTNVTLEELAASNGRAQEVYDSFRKFSARVEPWTRMSEGAYMAALKKA